MWSVPSPKAETGLGAYFASFLQLRKLNLLCTFPSHGARLLKATAKPSPLTSFWRTRFRREEFAVLKALLGLPLPQVEYEIPRLPSKDTGSTSLPSEPLLVFLFLETLSTPITINGS